jgi:hypothetical protein
MEGQSPTTTVSPKLTLSDCVFQAEKSRAIKFGRNLGDFSSKRTGDTASKQNFNLSTKQSEWPELRRVSPEKKPFQISNRASVSEDIKLGSVSDPNSTLETASFKCSQLGGSTDQHHRLTLGCVNAEIEGPLCLTGPANQFARRLQRLQSGKGRILSRRGLTDRFRRTQSLISPPLRSFVEVAREAMESGKKTMEGPVGGRGVGAGRGGGRAGGTPRKAWWR